MTNRAKQNSSRNPITGRFEAVSKPVEPRLKAKEYVSKLRNFKKKQAAKK